MPTTLHTGSTKSSEQAEGGSMDHRLFKDGVKDQGSFVSKGWMCGGEDTIL